MNRGKQNHKWTNRNENQINKPSRQLFLPHKLFTEHLVNVIENPPQKYNKNKKKLEPLIQRLKTNTDFYLQ
jgi:hypothetical protein